MDYDLVMKNIEELNNIAGEGEHYIKHTKDGARLRVRVLSYSFIFFFEDFVLLLILQTIQYRCSIFYICL